MKKIIIITLFLALTTYSCTSSQADFGANRTEEVIEHDSDMKARNNTGKITKAEKAIDVRK